MKKMRMCFPREKTFVDGFWNKVDRFLQTDYNYYNIE